MRKVYEITHCGVMLRASTKAVNVLTNRTVHKLVHLESKQTKNKVST